jgi:sugar-specific transcriptional regulator TrmB
LGVKKMLAQTELVKKIKDLGLNSYEAKIWIALLSRGISSAGELSEISNVPRSRAYDVLESLEKKGFIMMKLGKPIKYMAIHPNEVLNVIKKRIKEESVKQEAEMEKLRTSSILGELTILHTNGIETVEPTQLVGLLRNRENLYSQYENAIKNAEKTVSIVTSADGLHRKMLHMKKAFKKAAEKGVSIKILAPLGKDAEKIAKEYKDFAEIRHADMNARFVIVDGNKMIFMLTDDKDVHPSYDMGVWINTSYFATALSDLFEMMWKGM